MSFLARLLVLLCLASPPALAQTLTSVDCAAVFDDDGTRVGRLHGDREVFFEVDDIHFALRVSPTEISTGNIFFYLNSTCQPPAYLAHETGGDASIMPSTVVVGRTVYLPTGAPFSGEVQSRRNPSSPTCTTSSYTPRSGSGLGIRRPPPRLHPTLPRRGGNLALEAELPASPPPAIWASSPRWLCCWSSRALSAWHCFAAAPPQQRRATRQESIRKLTEPLTAHVASVVAFCGVSGLNCPKCSSVGFGCARWSHGSKDRAFWALCAR